MRTGAGHRGDDNTSSKPDARHARVHGVTARSDQTFLRSSAGLRAAVILSAAPGFIEFGVIGLSR